MRKIRLSGLLLILCSSCSEQVPESSFTKSANGVEVNQNLDKNDLPIKSYRIKNGDTGWKLIVSGLSCDNFALNKVREGSLKVYKIVGSHCTRSDEEKQLDLAEELGVSKNGKFIVVNTIN